MTRTLTPTNPIIAISSTQNHRTVMKELSTTLPEAMGKGGGHVPMITQGKEWITEVSPKSKQLRFPITIYSLVDSLARVSQLLEKEGDLTTLEELSSLKLLGF